MNPYKPGEAVTINNQPAIIVEDLGGDALDVLIDGRPFLVTRAEIEPRTTIETLRAEAARLRVELARVNDEIRAIEYAPLLAEADAMPERTRETLIAFDGAWHKGGVSGLAVESSYPSPNDPGYELCWRLTDHGAALRSALLWRRDRGEQ